MDREDDPTQALDDFVRRMRPSAPHAELPDLDGLLQRVAPSPPLSPARGGRLRTGETWSAEDVVDVPSIELPLVPPTVEAAPPPGADVLETVVAEAGRAAAAGFAADAAAAAMPWQLDIDAVVERRNRNPRLLAAWQPDAWIGAVREVCDATTEFVQTPAGPVVETYPPHRLLLAWPPLGAGRPLLCRWPAQVRLSAVPRDSAAEVLLAQLPDDAQLWLGASDDEVDWALAAEVVLHHEPGLRPFQIDALRAFIAAEREASFARVNTAYEQRMPGAAVTRRSDG